ncbi:hypothetical protein U1Q18_048476 [Sarracenia purpurea var. burkii]
MECLDGIDSGNKADLRSKNIFGKGKEPNLALFEDNFGRRGYGLEMGLANYDDEPEVNMTVGQPKEKRGLDGPMDYSPIPISHCTDPGEFTSTHSLNQNQRSNERPLEIRAQRWKRRARERIGPPNVVSVVRNGKKRKSEGKNGKEEDGELEQEADNKKTRVGGDLPGTHHTLETAVTDSQSRRAP